tara:strand:- start:3157 stop:5622 length:2466 start_codon:yes stop_codon:yes gene_type:complete
MSIYEPPWKAKLPGPARYYVNESITLLGQPSVRILPRPLDAPDSRTNYPAADHYTVPSWPSSLPYGTDPHAGDSERQTDEAAHAMPGGIYEDAWKTELPGPGSYDPSDVLGRPRNDIGAKMIPHDTWRTPPIPLWKQEVNNVPMRVLPSTLSSTPAIKLRHKPNDAIDSRADYPAPNHRAPKRWPNNEIRSIASSFHNSDAVPHSYERAHAMNGGIYDPQWKVELPGPGSQDPQMTLTKPSTTLLGTMAPHDTWRTAPLPRWKQEINNVPHVILPSTLNQYPAVKIQAKPIYPEEDAINNPAPDAYNVPRWPKEPYEKQKNGSADDEAVALRWQRETAQAALIEILKPEFPLEYESRVHINPAGTRYHPQDHLTRTSITTVTMTPHDTWRTEPIPLWKQEVNNAPYRVLPSTLETQPAVKIQAKPHYPEEDAIHNPGPGTYSLLRFPQDHHVSKAGNLGPKNTDIRGRIVQNQPSKPSSSLRPVNLPEGYKRGYSESLKEWFWYDPSGKKPIRIAHEDSSRWLAKRAKKDKSNNSNNKSYLYREDGGKIVRGVERTSKKWTKRKGQESKGALNSKKSSLFLNNATHLRTKSGMAIPRQSTTTLPLSSLRSQRDDLMAWVKKSRGPNVTAKDAPIVHGMYVKSVRPARASVEEVSKVLEQRIAGMSMRLETKGVHPTWEDEVSIQTFGNHTNTTNNKTKNVQVNLLQKLKHCVEQEKVVEETENDEMVTEIIKSTTDKRTSDTKTVTPGDTVFYRLPSGVIKKSKVVSLPTTNDGWTIRTRIGGPLIRQVRDVDIAIGKAPNCKCGKHGAHNGKCYVVKSMC